ncbi:M24 family metallopeptidase [Flavimaricola marinus]|uniref:Xaa-Pro dipeptidase n=1 Tax=Flavimaricola marinus TaxID=1819565 RepID=A0A238LCK5_9RHOB|nr:M24 family metallopeptidase [Flavimaricola marinus]SMY07419.1 Xaa-Pro dipeptidase [Flavimaricola marinus]
MVNPKPAFTDAEYASRIEKTRTAMDAAGIDVLIVSDPSNIAWLTGYDGWSFYVHQAVILGPSGDPLWWGRAMDRAGAIRTVWMGDEQLLGYDDSYVQNPAKHPMEDLSRHLHDLGWAYRSVGVEMDNYYFSAAAYNALLMQCPKANWRDATGLVNWQRAVKSDREITYMRRAAAIVTAMHARIVEVAEPGLAKNVLVAEIQRSGTLGADGHWGDYPAVVPMAPSGMDATAPHLTWDDSPLVAGVPTFFEIAGVYRRYHAPQSRTLVLAHAPDAYLHAADAIQAATNAALTAARPGQTCGDVARAFNAALAKHGHHKDSRCGYAIGLSYPPDWGERTMSLRGSDTTVLQPGMTFHLMPGLWLDDGGIEITEPILITDTGAACLAQTPSGLTVKH